VVGGVSWTPPEQNPARAPVNLGDCAYTLFLRRGDHCILRTALSDDHYVTYAALTYGVVPAFVLSDAPIVMADPLSAPIACYPWAT
jgi:hypothetical protein